MKPVYSAFDLGRSHCITLAVQPSDP